MKLKSTIDHPASLLLRLAIVLVIAAIVTVASPARAHAQADPYVADLQLPAGQGWFKGGCIPVRAMAYDPEGMAIIQYSYSMVVPSSNHPLAPYASSGFREVPVNGSNAVWMDTCFTLPPVSGPVSYRASSILAAPKAPNPNHREAGATGLVTLYNDVTGPVISGLTAAGTAFSNNRTFGSSVNYRPTVTFTTTDAHSGVASAAMRLDGNVVSNAGNWTSATRIPLGSHTLSVTVLDAVGNATVETRTFTIADDVAPSIAVATPASGDNLPTLDVTATDDYAGINPSTFSITVNGVAVPITTNTGRLVGALPRLVNGKHTIEVTVADNAGNPVTKTFTYTASSGAGDPAMPDGMTSGIYVYAAPTAATQGDTVRIAALMAKDGRPVTGRAELRKGVTTQAGKDLSANGAVDMALVINEAGPLQLHGPSGSGLTPADIAYTFTPAPAATCATDQRLCTERPPAERCALDPTLAICATLPGGGAGGTGGTGTGGTDGAGTGGTNGTNGTNGGAGAPGSANSASSAYCIVNNVAGCKAGFPTDVIYYVTVAGKDIPYWNGVPLAESGASLDRVAPMWKLQLIQSKKGVVRKTGKVKFRIYANELAVFQVTPVGAPRRSTIGTRNQWRTIVLDFGPKTKLGKQLRKAKAGSKVTVKLAIAGTDKNKNQSKLKTVTFKVIV